MGHRSIPEPITAQKDEALQLPSSESLNIQWARTGGRDVQLSGKPGHRNQESNGNWWAAHHQACVSLATKHVSTQDASGMGQCPILNSLPMQQYLHPSRKTGCKPKLVQGCKVNSRVKVSTQFHPSLLPRRKTVFPTIYHLKSPDSIQSVT